MELVDRTLEDQILKNLSDNKVVVLLGARRIGEKPIQRQLLK